MNVLVACEFSGIVRDAFLARGHNAMSCDLLPTESPGADAVTAPLHLFAHGRSGDKGDAANIGILARDPRMDDATYERIVALAESQGYSRDRIERTLQTSQP